MSRKKTKKNTQNNKNRSARSMRKIYGKRDRSLRDRLYNYSDILAVLVIILIAGLFITWRINALMNFEPEVVEPEPSSTEAVTNLAALQRAAEKEGSLPETSEEDQNADTDKTKSNQPADSDQVDNSNAEFRISSGSGLSTIATDLFKLGLISDPDEFQEAVTKAGKANRINTGTFSIPFGSTYDEIISIITS